MKYHNKGGTASKVYGRVMSVVINAPRHKKKHMAKSKDVVGNMSSLLPTSAENLLRTLPRGCVSKNSIRARRTAAVIASCSLREAWWRRIGDKMNVR